MFGPEADSVIGQSCPGAEPASASVVIPTRDRPQALSRCLEGVLQQDFPRFDVLVVDSAPRRPAAQEVAKRYGVRCLTEPILGASRARNRGARESTGEIIAFLDDDAVPARDWLSCLSREFRDGRTMAVTGRVLPLEIETDSQREFKDLGGFEITGDERRVLEREDPCWFEMACFGGIGNGANMAFRRAAFDVWPGFEERIGPGTSLQGGEDHYAFFSLVERGYRVVHTTQSIVRHPVPATREEWHRRYTAQLSASAAYMAFLFFEHPRYRRRLVRFLGEAAAGIRRPWRVNRARRRPAGISRLQRLKAYLKGLAQFIHARWFAPPSPASGITSVC